VSDEILTPLNTEGERGRKVGGDEGEKRLRGRKGARGRGEEKRDQDDACSEITHFSLNKNSLISQTNHYPKL